MNHTELLFALQMHERVIRELQEKFPNEMSSIRRQMCIEDNFEGYLIDAVEEVEKTARMIQNIRA